MANSTGGSKSGSSNKSKAPALSGLTVSRTGNKFKLEWSPVKNCTDQDIKVLVNSAEVHKEDLGKTTKKYEYTVNLSDFYPNSGKPALTEVSFKLAQKQKKKGESGYSGEKEFKIQVQGAPVYASPVQDSSHNDTFAYSWSKNSGDDDISTGHKMFTYYEYETCLVDNGQSANWALASTQKIQTINPSTGDPITDAPSHNTINDSTITSVIIRESQADIAARKRRYFHVRSVGPAGASSWTESEHRLGASDPPTVQTSKINFNGSTDTGSSGSIPLEGVDLEPGDTTIVEYAIAAPYVTTTEEGNRVRSKLVVPPAFNSWTTGATFAGTGKPDLFSFNWSDGVVEDTQLFMRVNIQHDNIVTNGVPFIMDKRQKPLTNSLTIHDLNGKAYSYGGASYPETFVGTLSAPTFSSVSVNEGTNEVTIRCTNNSQLANGGNRSFIAVYERISGSKKAIGIIPYSSGEVTFTCRYDSSGVDAFGIQCFVADYSPINRKPSGVTDYGISDIKMQSSGVIWQEDVLSKRPENVKVQRYNSTTVFIKWDWTWDQADSAEISWSDNLITWESIEEPSTYILSNTRNGQRYITGLSPTTYYFRVRFIRTEDDTTTYGVYSETVSITLSSAPDIPTVTLSDVDHVVTVSDQVTAYWTYRSTDGTDQAYAKVAEAVKVNNAWTYNELQGGYIENGETHFTFTPEQYDWMNGQTHYISVKVGSESGKESEGYSSPVALKIAPRPHMSISGINGTNDAIRRPRQGEDEFGYTPYVLKKLPIEFDVIGSTRKGYCSVVIERAENFSIRRPDETKVTGYKGETIISKTFEPTPNSTSLAIHVSITASDLKLGSLDNTAPYVMYVSFTDDYGQTTTPSEFKFRVAWDHYALMPNAVIDIREDEDIAIITPAANFVGEIPEGDYCQIYRMSADKPQLILGHGSFLTSYVDPYPTYGLYGGYKIVYVTKYMDNKTEDNLIAETEYSIVGNDEDIERYDRFMVSVDFDGYTAEFDGNVSLSHSWEKDFQTTRYLGGSIQGDWNPGVQRTGSINGTVPVEYDPDTIYALRLLADYPGRCHVRTPEGSNFIADVQVKDDREEKWTTRLGKVSLSYTKVDGGEEDAVTLADWRKDHPLPTP